MLMCLSHDIWVMWLGPPLYLARPSASYSYALTLKNNKSHILFISPGCCSCYPRSRPPTGYKPSCFSLIVPFISDAFSTDGIHELPPSLPIGRFTEFGFQAPTANRFNLSFWTVLVRCCRQMASNQNTTPGSITQFISQGPQLSKVTRENFTKWHRELSNSLFVIDAEDHILKPVAELEPPGIPEDARQNVRRKRMMALNLIMQSLSDTDYNACINTGYINTSRNPFKLL